MDKSIPSYIPKKYQARISHCDDERACGNSLIASLANGWHWAGIYPLGAMHVAGFDTVKEVLAELWDTTKCECPECQAAPTTLA
jgi:hypothetical protein